MKPLNIIETKQSPKVILDKEKNIFEISGKSLPENVLMFYTPIFNWLNEYIKSPNPETVLILNITYHNTSTAKAILNILRILYKLIETDKSVEIHWYCKENDEDAIEEGEDFAELAQIPIKIRHL